MTSAARAATRRSQASGQRAAPGRRARSASVASRSPRPGPRRLAEEIALLWAYELAGRSLRSVVGQPPDHDGWNPFIRLAHQQRGRGGDFVGKSDHRRLELVAEEIALAALVFDGAHAGDADGDACRALSPRPSMAVIDDDGHSLARELMQSVCQPSGGGIRIERQQRGHGAGPRGNVGAIDAGVGAYPARALLHDDHPLMDAQYLIAL